MLVLHRSCRYNILTDNNNHNKVREMKKKNNLIHLLVYPKSRVGVIDSIDFLSSLLSLHNFFFQRNNNNLKKSQRK